MNDSASELDSFLASVERRAQRIAEIATRDRDEALDIVQDSMIQLAKKYAARPASEWTPLFYRILNNKVLDWQRRGTVRRRVLFWQDDKADGDDFNPAELVADMSQPNAQDLLQQQQAMQKLEEALRALPARQRETFTLRIWEGLSVEDTAKAMGCSDGSVKTHLFRALATLREQLEGVWN
ncbi:MAG: RNA polymerase sigma factor [Pseudomonadota bacterium]